MFIPHLSTISRKSWHYRVVFKINELFSEPMPKSPCKYWLVELPLALVSVIFFGVVALAIAASALFLIGDGAWWATRHPLNALGDLGLLLLGVIGFVLVILSCVWGEKQIKRRCPPLTITD